MPATAATVPSRSAAQACFTEYSCRPICIASASCPACAGVRGSGSRSAGIPPMPVELGQGAILGPWYDPGALLAGREPDLPPTALRRADSLDSSCTRMLFPKDSSIRLLGVFQALDTFSELLAFFATGLVAYDRTHSTLVVSAVMTAVALAEAAGALLGGAFADRFDRKRVALMAAISAGCLLLVLALGTNLIALTAVMVGMTIAAAPIRPAVFAALPNLLVRDELDTANSYLQTLRQGAFALSPIVAGFGAAAIGASGLFVCAASMFGLAAIVLLCVRGRFHEEAVADSPAETRFSPLAGVQLIRRDRVL